MIRPSTPGRGGVGPVAGGMPPMMGGGLVPPQTGRPGTRSGPMMMRPPIPAGMEQFVPPPSTGIRPPTGSLRPITGLVPPGQLQVVFRVLADH